MRTCYVLSYKYFAILFVIIVITSCRSTRYAQLPDSSSNWDDSSKVSTKNSGSVDLLKDKNYIVVPVCYGTDRNEIRTAKKSIDYGSLRGSENYSTGIVYVTIPNTHEIGEVESPWWIKFWDRDNPSRYFTIARILELPYNTFYKKINENCKKYNNDSVLIFIHGFNNSFTDAAKRAAQIAYDINFHGTTFMYSWPSDGNAESYLQDETSMEWSMPHFSKFLEDIATKTKSKNMNIIAHSMGNRALAHALKTFNDKHSDIHLNQVILAAPDIDTKVFIRDILPCFTGRANKFTLYCSDNDEALKLSQKARGGYTRLGEAGSNICVSPNLETIDASSVLVNDFFGHTYFANTTTLLKDIQQLIHFNRPPQDRQLKPVIQASKTYWTFP